VKRLSTAILVCLPLALGLAWQLGGALGTGVLVGFLSAAAVSGLGVAWLLHVGRTRPQQYLSAFGVSFASKLVVALMGGLAFRYIEPAALRVDHRSFLLAFASAALILLLVGVTEVSRVLRGAPLAQGSPAHGERSSGSAGPGLAPSSRAGAPSPLPATGLAANEGTRS